MSLHRGNLFLVGLMGAGKTTLGRQLARRLDRTFVDADHELEARLGVPIPTIFELEGEAGFRDREEALIGELAQRTNVVLATGGGAVMREGSRQCLRANGTVLYLHAEPETLWQKLRCCSLSAKKFAHASPLPYTCTSDLSMSTGSAPSSGLG